MLLRIRISESTIPLDEINFVISNFMDIERSYNTKHILNKKILKINNAHKDMLGIIAI